MAQRTLINVAGINDGQPLIWNAATRLLVPGSLGWGFITGKPTTLGGYGITDAVLNNARSVILGTTAGGLRLDVAGQTGAGIWVRFGGPGGSMYVDAEGDLFLRRLLSPAPGLAELALTNNGMGVRIQSPVAALHVKNFNNAFPGLIVEPATGQSAPLFILRALTSLLNARDVGIYDATCYDATDASWKGRVIESVSDYLGRREVLRKWANGSLARIAFAAPATAPTDADLGTSQISFFLDETAGAVKIRVKQSDGATYTFTPATGSPDWSSITGKPVSFTPSPHATTHASGGSDPVSPASIGAATTTALATTNTNLSTHIADTTNPHVVTKAQVGLGNVDNTSDANKPISTAQQAALDLKASAASLATHISDVTNPHVVTKAQVGLGNVDNTSDASKPVSTAQQTALNTKEGSIAAGTTAQYWRGDKTWRDLATDIRAAVLTGLSTATGGVIAATDSVLAALGKLQNQITANTTNIATNTSSISTHVADTNNPHLVTKSQVGLGSVDNTSDVNKPVSSAQQTALNLKLNKTDAGTSSALGAVKIKGTPTDAANPTVYVSESAGPRTLGGAIFDGGNNVPTTPYYGMFTAGFAGTIDSVEIYAFDANGNAVSASAQFDIWKCDYASYPPTISNTITAAALPTLSSANKSKDSTLTGWTKTFSKGDIFFIKLVSASTATRFQIFLKATIS